MNALLFPPPYVNIWKIFGLPHYVFKIDNDSLILAVVPVSLLLFTYATLFLDLHKLSRSG